MTEAEFILWLQSPTSVRCVLVEAYANIAGTETLIYLSNANYITGAADTPANKAYLAILGGGISITEQLSIDGTASLTFGDIELDNNGDYDSWLDYVWTNRSVNVFLGDPNWVRSEFRKVFSGTLSGITTRSNTTLNLSIRDKLQRLNTPMTEAKLGGLTDNKDAILPLCFGEVHNVSPLLIDPALLKYQVHDGAIERIIEVRDNGMPVGFTANLTTGTFVLTAQSFGTVTCSVQGDKFGGTYRNTISALVQRLVTGYGLPADRFVAADLDASNLSAFASAHTQPVGIYLSDRTNVLEVCASLAASVGAQLVMSRPGLLRLLKIALPAVGTPKAVTSSNMEANSLSISNRPEVVAGVTLGYNRNYLTQTGLLTGITEVQKDLFAKEWLTVTATDATVAEKYKLTAVPVQVDTMLITNVTANPTATNEANRRLALWKVQRTVFSYGGTPDLLLETLGGAQTITHNRFGLASGLTGQIVGMTQDWATGKIAFEVLI